MTDYLDALLEQREQEDGDILQWHRARAYALRGKTAGTKDDTVQATSAADEALAAAREERVRGASKLLEQVQRLHRAVQQAGEAGRRVASFPTAAPVDPVNGRYGAALPVRRAADYAAAVDAAFQRDARRYDGPMELPR